MTFGRGQARGSRPIMSVMRRPRPTDIASLLFWLACSVLTLMSIYDGATTGAQAYAWLAAFTLFGATLIAAMMKRPPEGRLGLARAYCFVLVVSGLMMVAFAVGPAKYPMAALLIFSGFRLPEIMPERRARLAVAAIALLLAVVLWWQAGMAAALVSGSAIGAGLVFAISFSEQGLRERAIRTDLAIANAELRASRELLAENSRVAERLRISRDLHDALGHHLVALSIQLDVASRRVPDPAAQDIREAHSLTRLLLSDVRDIIGTLRREVHTDAVTLIRPLCRNIGDLSIHFHAPEGVHLVDSAQAEALVRYVQEVITNALKHATAGNLWIELRPGTRGITVCARDDGRGAQQLEPGTGLTGMRERFAQLGGDVAVTTLAGSGFEVKAFMPTTKMPT
jgi:signal transduction histidine kinase